MRRLVDIVLLRESKTYTARVDIAAKRVVEALRKRGITDFAP